MIRTLTIALALSLPALGPAPADAQTGPGIIRDTGPSHCPEMAGTDTPFRIICPSWEAEVGAHSFPIPPAGARSASQRPGGVAVTVTLSGDDGTNTE